MLKIICITPHDIFIFILLSSIKSNAPVFHINGKLLREPCKSGQESKHVYSKVKNIGFSFCNSDSRFTFVFVNEKWKKTRQKDYSYHFNYLYIIRLFKIKGDLYNFEIIVLAKNSVGQSILNDQTGLLAVYELIYYPLWFRTSVCFYLPLTHLNLIKRPVCFW